MDPFTNEGSRELIQKAAAGDKPSLETVMLSVQDLVFFHLGIPYCGQSPQGLQKAHVRPISLKLWILWG